MKELGRKKPLDEEWIEDLESALKEDQGLDLLDEEAKAQRYLRLYPKQPKRVRATIIRQVANNHGLSERMVESCWKLFRSDFFNFDRNCMSDQKPSE